MEEQSYDLTQLNMLEDAFGTDMQRSKTTSSVHHAVLGGCAHAAYIGVDSPTLALTVRRWPELDALVREHGIDALVSDCFDAQRPEAVAASYLAFNKLQVMLGPHSFPPDMLPRYGMQLAARLTPLTCKSSSLCHVELDIPSTRINMERLLGGAQREAITDPSCMLQHIGGLPYVESYIPSRMQLPKITVLAQLRLDDDRTIPLRWPTDAVALRVVLHRLLRSTAHALRTQGGDDIAAEIACIYTLEIHDCEVMSTRLDGALVKAKLVVHAPESRWRLLETRHPCELFYSESLLGTMVLYHEFQHPLRSGWYLQHPDAVAVTVHVHLTAEFPGLRNVRIPHPRVLGDGCSPTTQLLQADVLRGLAQLQAVPCTSVPTFAGLQPLPSVDIEPHANTFVIVFAGAHRLLEVLPLGARGNMQSRITPVQPRCAGVEVYACIAPSPGTGRGGHGVIVNVSGAQLQNPAAWMHTLQRQRSKASKGHN